MIIPVMRKHLIVLGMHSADIRALRLRRGPFYIFAAECDEAVDDNMTMAAMAWRE